MDSPTPPLNNADVIEREIRIAAKPETIFPFFTDPEKMMRWMGASVALDPRPGGIYRVAINEQNITRGQFLEVIPFSRVVFTWGWEDPVNVVPPGSTTVEIVLIPEGSQTLVRLRHSGIADPNEVKSHAEGWDHYLPRLLQVITQGDAGPDPWAQSSSM